MPPSPRYLWAVLPNVPVAMGFPYWPGSLRPSAPCPSAQSQPGGGGDRQAQGPRCDPGRAPHRYLLASMPCGLHLDPAPDLPQQPFWTTVRTSRSGPGFTLGVPWDGGVVWGIWPWATSPPGRGVGLTQPPARPAQYLAGTQGKQISYLTWWGGLRGFPLLCGRALCVNLSVSPCTCVSEACEWLCL